MPQDLRPLALLVATHLFVTALAWHLARGAATHQRVARVTIAVLVGLPVVANGLMIAAPPDAGADGLGRFWPGVVALLTIPASWVGALLVGGLSRHRARIESGSSD